MEYEKKVEITQKKTGQRKQEEQEVRVVITNVC